MLHIGQGFFLKLCNYLSFSDEPILEFIEKIMFKKNREMYSLI